MEERPLFHQTIPATTTIPNRDVKSKPKHVLYTDFTEEAGVKRMVQILYWP